MKTNSNKRHVLYCSGAALALLLGWGFLRGAPVVNPDPPPAESVAVTPASVPVAASPSPVPAYPFTDCSGDQEIAICFGLPTPDGRTADMSTQEIVAAMGGSESMEADLGWEGYSLEGTAYYQGDQLLWLQVSGEKDAASFQVSLAPGGMPPANVEYASAKSTRIGDLEPTLYFVERDGVFTYHADYMIYGMGVRFQCSSPSQETARELASRVIARSEHRGGYEFDTEPLW